MWLEFLHVLSHVSKLGHSSLIECCQPVPFGQYFQCNLYFGFVMVPQCQQVPLS